MESMIKFSNLLGQSKNALVFYNSFQFPSQLIEAEIKRAKYIAEQYSADLLLYTTSSNKTILGESLIHTDLSESDLLSQLSQEYSKVTKLPVNESLIEKQNFQITEASIEGNLDKVSALLFAESRDLDIRNVVNQVRKKEGLELIKEDIENTNPLRESYIKGDIFKLDQIVESEGIKYIIIDRGANYLILEDIEGNVVNKWLDDVTTIEVSEEESAKFKEITEQKVPVMTAAHMHAHLTKNGWTKSKNNGGHHVYNHPKSKFNIAVPNHKGDLAPGTVRQILKKSQLQEAKINDILSKEDKAKLGKVGKSLGATSDTNRKQIVKYMQEEFTEEELQEMVDSITDLEDIIDLYEDEDLIIIDEETGEEVVIEESVQLVEVLSRVERMRAKIRFAKTEAKRERQIKIALRKRADSKTLNKRARKLAIETMKRKITKKDPATLSIQEKERVERIIEKRKDQVNRLAMRMIPKVRKIEQSRLDIKHTTKAPAKK